MNHSRNERLSRLGSSGSVSLKFVRDHSQSSLVRSEEGRTAVIGLACTIHNCLSIKRPFEVHWLSEGPFDVFNSLVRGKKAEHQ